MRLVVERGVGVGGGSEDPSLPLSVPFFIVYWVAMATQWGRGAGSLGHSWREKLGATESLLGDSASCLTWLSLGLLICEVAAGSPRGAAVTFNRKLKRHVHGDFKGQREWTFRDESLQKGEQQVQSP